MIPVTSLDDPNYLVVFAVERREPPDQLLLEVRQILLWEGCEALVTTGESSPINVFP